MRHWALPLLRCQACGATALHTGSDAVICDACGLSYPTRDDVSDFLHELHPVASRERTAVHQIDRRQGAPAEWTADVLGRLHEGRLTAEEVAGTPHLRVIEESREQVLDLLAREPLPPDAVVLELGADVGWVSSILVDAGCRVIGTDITDHLFLAPYRDSPRLCRILADMNRVPFGDATMDAVWATACVHHSWDLRRTFREIARVLRPGGQAWLCCEPIPPRLRYVLARGVGDEERALGINETWIARGTWLDACRAAGLHPRLIRPRLDPNRLRERLARHRLPPAAAALMRPVLPWLQVSVHLLAAKPAA